MKDTATVTTTTTFIRDAKDRAARRGRHKAVEPLPRTKRIRRALRLRRRPARRLG